MVLLLSGAFRKLKWSPWLVFCLTLWSPASKAILTTTQASATDFIYKGRPQIFYHHHLQIINKSSTFHVAFSLQCFCSSWTFSMFPTFNLCVCTYLLLLFLHMECILFCFFLCIICVVFCFWLYIIGHLYAIIVYYSNR